MLTDLLTNPTGQNYWIPEPYIQIGGLQIRYYALCLITGIICAAILARLLFKKRGIDPDFILDLLIIVLPLSIIGARLWWVVCDLEQINGFWDAFKIWDGGISILGALLGGAVGIIIACRIYKKNILDILDVAAAVVPLGQCLGRWGNFMNGEVYGAETSIKWFPYSVPINLGSIENPRVKYYVALFFRESVIDFLIFALLFTFLLFYKGKRKGYALTAYLFLYCLTRTIQETMRDSQFNMSWGKGVPYMSIICGIVALLGLGAFVYLLVKDIKEKNYWWKDFFKKPKEETVLEKPVEEEK